MFIVCDFVSLYKKYYDDSLKVYVILCFSDGVKGRKFKG